MAFSWRMTPLEAYVASDGPASFASQSDAESWLGQTWRDLAAAGVIDVALVDGVTVVYDLSLA